MSARALKMILSRSGWEVTVAHTLADGFAKLAEQPQWLILDLMLPDGNGVEMLRYVRTAQLPIQVMVTTAVSDPERLSHVNQLKPECVIRKPFDLTVMMRELNGPEV